MAIYTFSTRPKKQEDTVLVEDIKKQCDREGKNFSALIIRLLREHNERKIQNSK